MDVWKRLDAFWKHCDCSTKFKILVYDAMIKSKLTYGLDTIELTAAMQKRLNAFQIKGLRKILGLKHVYYDRRNTNEYVLKSAEEAINIRTGKHKKYTTIKTVTDIINDKKAKLLGHIIRADNEDPMRQVTFVRDSININYTNKRRVGRPRGKWVESTLKQAWSYENSLEEYDNDNSEHNRRIINRAKRREEPFNKSKAEIAKETAEKAEFRRRRRFFDRDETFLYRQAHGV